MPQVFATRILHLWHHLKLLYSVKLWQWKSLMNLTNECWIVKIFPTKILLLEFWYPLHILQLQFTNLSLSGFVTLCQDMESSSTFVWLPVRRILLKTRIHLKEWSYPIHLHHIYWRLYHHHRHQGAIASCNAEVTKVLKQGKLSVTKNCCTKVTPAQRYEIGKFSILVTTW